MEKKNVESGEILLEVKNLKKYYPVRTGFIKKTELKAVDDVSFFIRKGETLGAKDLCLAVIIKFSDNVALCAGCVTDIYILIYLCDGHGIITGRSHLHNFLLLLTICDLCAHTCQCGIQSGSHSHHPSASKNHCTGHTAGRKFH